MKNRLYTFVLGMACYGILISGITYAQVELLPVTWQPVYTVDRTALPDYVVGAYLGNPEGTIAAAIEAIDQAQTGLNEQWAANGLTGGPINIRAQVYAHILSMELAEAEHYLINRAAERGITRENDPKFFAAIDTLKGGLQP